MIDGNDGGVDISTDGGETWYAPPLPIGQFYHVARRQPRARSTSPARMQDLGTAQGPSNSLTRGGHRAAATGTTSAAARPATSSPNPTIPNIVYAGEYLGYHLALRPPHRQARNVSA